MSAKKCCGCGLLSCFPCFSNKKSTLSAQPDSSEIALPPLTMITSPSPAATLSSAPSHQLSSSAPPSAAAPSQVNGSTVMQNDSQPTAPSDAVPSSSRGIVTPFALIPTTSQTTASTSDAPSSSTSAVPSSSTPSSIVLKEPDYTRQIRRDADAVDRGNKEADLDELKTPSSPRLPTESYYAETIMEAVKELDKENVDGDFSDLINYISRLLDFIEEEKKGENQSMPKAPVGSKTFLRLKEVVSEGDAVKDIATVHGKTFLMGFLKGMGMAHMVTTGFLVAASILERHEAVSANKEACLYLLKQMNILAKYVQQLQQRPELKKRMEAPIREATMLIVEASIDCCTQVDASKSSRFISTTVNGEALAKFQKKLADTHTHMQAEMGFCQFDVINQIDMCLRKGHELKYPEYPKGAVGIEDPLREVIERLEIGSDKNAVAVIVHGFGGMGKTTLADAVFAWLFDTNREGYKYSYVRLFDTIASTPNIVELQRSILTDLMMGEESEIPGIRRYEEGQQVIEDMLEKEAVFIYIDNVLLPDKVEQGRDALHHLLPRNMRNARKLRLLLTTRDKDAVDAMRITGVKPVFYSIQSLPKQEALYLFLKTLDDNSEKQLQPKQLKICKSEDLEKLSEGSLHGMKAARSKDSIFELGASSSPSVSEVGYFSTRTLPTIPTESYYAEKIREAAAAVENVENATDDLSELSNYVSQLLNSRKEKKMGNDPLKPTGAKYFLPNSNRFFKLKEFLSEGTNAVKGFGRGERETFIRHFLEDMEMPNMVATGFLVQANVLERYESISTNKEACLSLLNEMNTLAQDVKELHTHPELREAMKFAITKATTLMVEASLACCTQIDASKFSGFFLSTLGKGELAKFEKKLQEMGTQLRDVMYFWDLSHAVLQPESHFAKYPKYADIVAPQGIEKPVRIKEPVQEVIELLEWESYKNAVAVILHGIGGMGKTTLADAVFARLSEQKTEECKFCYVRLFQDIKSTPNVIELQKSILRKLKREEPEEIRSYEEGQKQIAVMLQKEEAFIYIDNVQGPDALTQLLPENMANAKKLRLLITTPNKDAASRMIMSKGVEKEIYEIQSLPKAEAETLLKKELNGNEIQLNASQIDGIVEICGGVPALLKVLAGFINGGEGSAVQNYETLMREAKEKNWKGFIGESIKQYVFAYDKLEDELKDPFLDICSFFRGWDWKELSDIVGDLELKMLKKRALVTRDVKSMTARVHDVIVEVGLQRTQGNRFRLTTATEIEKFSHIKDEDLQKIKGIWASDNKYPLRIPASKLDLMSGSLRVLKLGPLTDVEGKCEKKFKELVFFSAITSDLPFYVSKLKGFKKLRHLCYNPADLQNLSQMPSNLIHVDIKLNSPAFQVSSNCIQRLRNLRVLRLSNAQFKSLPQELGDMGNGLEEVSISGCQYLEELSISGCQYLEEVSISTLESLRVLRMDDCSRLTRLAKGLGSLTSLQELYLIGCESLEALPGELENLTSLQKLDLSKCRLLTALPSGLENLTSLQKLDLSGCQCLNELPSSLGKLRSLQELSLRDCALLKALPPSLEELSLLRSLDLSCCLRLEDLPCGLEKLTSLVELKLHSCQRLSSIPENIGMLKLNSINLKFADSLKDLPDGFCNFSILTELVMTHCVSLEKLPDRFGAVTSLRKLIMMSCGRLQKLPESFNQLKHLEHLDLSRCSTLKELPIYFKDLSLLRVLSLEGCDKLKKLPEDFQCLTSLEVLDVRHCNKLEGKWIDSMLKMEKLQILRIARSKLLEERWEEIQAQQCNQSWPCAVYTEQGLSNQENLLKQLQPKFDSMLTNGEREPLNISALPLHTVLLVMFDGQQEFRPHFPLPLLEESIDDIQTHFEMVYFGNHWDQLPKKVADRIVGHAPANRDAKALFQKLLSLFLHYQTDFDPYLTWSFQMTAEIVSGEKGDKYLSRWKCLGDVGNEMNEEVEDFVVTKRGRYVKLKQLAERGGESPIALITELFRGGEEEISLSFLKNQDGESTKVGVDELKGKTILLDIRPANMCYAIPLHALVEMYNVEKERFNFEIITVAIMQDNSKLDVYEKFSREVPWLVLENPWQLTNATKYFLVEGRPQWPKGWDSWYPNTMRIIKSNGTIAPYRNPGVLRMVNTWGAAAYPFTAEKEEELIQKEKTQMEAMSHAMFLFQHLERVAEQLREATGQQKMIWLCCCHEKEFTNSMKNVLTELSDIIYIIYIPNFTEGVHERGYFTATISEEWNSLEPSKMSSEEMGGIFSLSLSEYEAIRFWARIRSLKEGIIAKDQIQLPDMLRIPVDSLYNPDPWMFIMDEDGNLITTEGKEIVKLLSEKYSDDRVKELMQQLIRGTKNSWKETLFKFLKLQKMSCIDSEDSDGELEEFDIEDSEGELEEFDSEDSEGDLEESDDVESQGNLSEELCSDDADREGDELGNT